MRRRLWGRWRLAPTFVVAPHARLMFITSYFVFAVALVLPFTGQGALWPLGWRFEDVDPAQVNICDVRNYGAKGDCVTKDTNALRDALIDCGGNATPGAPAAVLLQDGCFLSGAVNLTSYTQLQLRNATLLGSPDEEDYPVVPALPSYGTCRDGNYPDEHKYARHQALVSGWHVVGASVAGLDSGMRSSVNGNGAVWWKRFHDKQLQWGRPRLVEPMLCMDFSLQNVDLVNSSFWTLHPYACDKVHIADVAISAPNTGDQLAPNTDGVDPDSTTNVLVERVAVSVGDDAVAIKSGIDWFGRNFGRATANVTMRDCDFTARHVSIGSEMSGGVHNITFDSCRMGSFSTGPRGNSSERAAIAVGGAPNDIGINLKTEPGRGGVVSDIVARNTTLGDCRGQTPINIRMDYGGGGHAANESATPHYANITIDGMTTIVTNGAQGVAPAKIVGLPESTIDGLLLRNIQLPGAKAAGWDCEYVKDAAASDVSPPPPPSCGGNS